MKIAVIPARGGSKRIPRKNIKLFCGKPIIAYSIEVARSCNLFEKVIVSTDDEEIAAISREHGAETPFLRPPQISDDYTGTNAVAKHALSWFTDRGEAIDFACCIYATVPLLQQKYLEEGYRKLSESDKQFAFSVTTFPSPILRSIRINSDGAIEANWPEHYATRSQDLEEAYHDAGQFYWGRAEAFLNDIPLYQPTSLPVVVPRYLVQDIDTLEDWRRAELMYKLIESEKENEDV